MSIEAAHLNGLNRGVSPASSGRSSPLPRLRSRATDEPVKKDKSYRRYVSGIERALALFDTALQEWADYISFLGRLLKALQARPHGVTDVPHKSVVARRLAQCLNPTLPSGVHQKALEIYAYIFSLLGRDGLARDLHVYLPGLSPVLAFASLSVKPTTLSIYETFISEADSRAVRPALRSIILALLPGLEEERSDEFERTLRILDKFKNALSFEEKVDGASNRHDAVGDQYFWQCLFLASITSVSRRQGALAYMVHRLPKLGSPTISANSSIQLDGNQKLHCQASATPPSVNAVTSPEPGLLIRCFATALRDEQLLVQRGFLELLTTHLPLSSAVLHQKMVEKDLQELVAAATSVVSRRDMSLNRRLWSWFLGPETSAESRVNPFNPPGTPQLETSTTPTPTPRPNQNQSRYFELYGLTPLARSMQDTIASNSSAPTVRARPFRICLSLMDRWEIGSLLIPRLFLPAMESVYEYRKATPYLESFNEVLRSASIFFDGVESGLIWGEILKLVKKGLKIYQDGSDASQRDLGIVYFIITNFNIGEEEMRIVHIPMVALSLAMYLEQYVQATQNMVSYESVHIALKISNHLLDVVPARAFAPKSQSQHQDIILPTAAKEELRYISSFYENDQQNPDAAKDPLPGQILGQRLLQIALNMNLQGLITDQYRESRELEISLLDKMLRKVPARDIRGAEGVFASLAQAAKKLSISEHTNYRFPAIALVVKSLEVFCGVSITGSWLSDAQIRQVIPDLIKGIWSDLSPSTPIYNSEAVRCMRRLQSLSSDPRLAESSIAMLMVTSESTASRKGIAVESARRLATLWSFQLSSGSDTLESRKSFMLNVSGKFKNDAEEEVLVLARPVLLLLDALSDTRTELFILTSTWLQSLPSVQVIVDLIMSELETQANLFLLSTAEPVIPTKTEGIDADSAESEGLVYYMHLLLSMLQYSPNNTWSALNSPLLVNGPEDGQRMNDDEQTIPSIQLFLIRLSFQILESSFKTNPQVSASGPDLTHTTILLIRAFMLGPSSENLTGLDIDLVLVKSLSKAIEHSDTILQVALMELILIAFRRTEEIQPIHSNIKHRKTISRETVRSQSRPSITTDMSALEKDFTGGKLAPPGLLDCIMSGLATPSSWLVLEHWIRFLDECMSMYADTAFQILLPLVDRFCSTITSVFKGLRETFEIPGSVLSGTFQPITTITTLLDGLEQALARSHDRLITNELGIVSVKTPEQTQSFFGSMVSGVFTSDVGKSPTTPANSRLTVLLCFKDAVRVCVMLWSWSEDGARGPKRDIKASASFNHASLRLRNRTRRILEHLFAAETLECLETMIELWYKADTEEGTTYSHQVLNLLHVLDGSNPKIMVPALFNSLYSRTNPNALEPIRRSTLASNLSDVELVVFLVTYTKSLEDDAMDEIWRDCVTFLRDVLTNPMPHRQILPKLLEFTAVLGEKIDNTNNGDQRKMRRSLGDIFVRLLTAIFTTQPLSFLNDGNTNADKNSRELNKSWKSLEVRRPAVTEDVVSILASILPNLSKILADPDHLTATATIISAQVLSPTMRSKSFPEYVSKSTLAILSAMSRIPEASKIWRKDVAAAFEDARFFSPSSYWLAHEGWLPILQEWGLMEKDRVAEILARLSSPTSAGIMFGVGASAARLEADRKTQLNLRKMALLILAATNDIFMVNLNGIQEKLVELMTATAASSPSSTTRAEIYMLFRALIFKTSPIHLTSLWPIINSELQDVLSSMFPGESRDTYNVYCVLQACKLLDALLAINPDDFQLQEWLFITDTIDAVYRPSDWDPVAIVDELAEGLDTINGASYDNISSFANSTSSGKRKPLLTMIATREVPKDELIDRVLRPFFRQLSINAYESTYSMEPPDLEACCDDLLADLFDDSTLV